MRLTWPIRIAAVLGFLSVGLGAFGAHGLKDVLARNDMGAVWEKAVFYQFIHSVMMYMLAVRSPWPRGPWWCFLAGILLFSGSLYVLALTGRTGLGIITPFGGTSFLAGWLWLALKPRGTQASGQAPGK
jgi:uncharacterized membrane protein YgdD (TMEM256/DUF423 family)